MEKSSSSSREIELVEEMEPMAELGSPSSSRIPVFPITKEQYHKVCVPLYRSTLKGDWEAANEIVRGHPWVVRCGITKDNDTPLHIAVATGLVRFEEEMVKMMTQEELEIRNNRGDTALFYAVMTGNLKIAELMIDKNTRLPMIRGNRRVTPLYTAASFGHSDLVWYLYRRTRIEELDTVTDVIEILNKCICSDLYDVALDMVQHYPMLCVISDENNEMALDVLVRKIAFSSPNHRGTWKKLISSIVKIGRHKRPQQFKAMSLVRIIWQEVSKLYEPEYREQSELNSRLIKLSRRPSQTGFLFVAAKLGNAMFLIELIRSYPDLIWEVDDENRSIFHIAVLYRHPSILNLLFEIGSIKEVLISYLDIYGNNILHLAGKQAPLDQFRVESGETFQLLQDLLWFKAVENMVPPAFKQWKNYEGKTPHVLFSEMHKDLLKDGQEQIKNTASQFIIVAALIATVMFTAAFTVPGGNRGDSGIPLFLKKSSFKVFVISDGIALIASSTSILMFLSIFTSSLTENDFLVWLPSKLIIGFLTLFISIVTMMVAFSASFFLIYFKDFKWVSIIIALSSIVPIMFFAALSSIVPIMFLATSQRRLLLNSLTNPTGSAYGSWNPLKPKIFLLK